MLENLPYYIIDKLKVYEESSLRSQALGHEVDAKLYVMDVQVKRSMPLVISAMLRLPVVHTIAIWPDSLPCAFRITRAFLFRRVE